MSASEVRLVTIVIGSEYKYELRDKLVELGAPGFTYFEVHGHGAHDPRVSFFDGTNLQFQVLATPEIADRILGYLETHYLPHTGLVAYVQAVDAIPAGHFGNPAPSAQPRG